MEMKIQKIALKKRLLIKTVTFRGGEIAPWIKVLATKPEDLNLIAGA